MRNERNFRNQVLEIVNHIPAGSTLSYGDVAALAGSPRAARVVGMILSGLGLNEQNIPWWRVVNKAGYLSIRGHDASAKELQKQLLQAEGVKVDDSYHIIR